MTEENGTIRERLRRRFPGRCYFCGDPCALDAWFCIAHEWAGGLVEDPARGLDYLSAEHRFWIARFSRKEIVDMGGYLERPLVRSLRP